MVLPQVEATSTFFWQDVSLNSVALLSLHALLAFINVGLCRVVVSACFGTPGSTTEGLFYELKLGVLWSPT